MTIVRETDGLEYHLAVLSRPKMGDVRQFVLHGENGEPTPDDIAAWLREHPEAAAKIVQDLKDSPPKVAQPWRDEDSYCYRRRLFDEEPDNRDWDVAWCERCDDSRNLWLAGGPGHNDEGENYGPSEPDYQGKAAAQAAADAWLVEAGYTLMENGE